MVRFSLYILLMAMVFGTSCKNNEETKFQILRSKELAIKNKVHNKLMDIEKEQGWSLLFDGKTLEGWHLYNKPDSTRFSAWEVQEGTLYCNATDESRIFGDLVTDKEYENYELLFEWQMALRGNGGVFINVQENPKYKATYETGPEYQLLEPEHMDTKTPLKRPGCLWGISPQLNKIEAKSVGEWNTARIIQQEGVIKFYLNGKLTAEEDLTSREWRNKIANSNFKDALGFGKVTKGKIALQNWYFEAWFRNMKIREL
ncbi:3-keto-disaccharide hydrolase [Eudoraea chungangensis]|uniref:3-keto-disaccharide hydrolase n=1 Tax=Eudoraea chungangensis TaxID=1481905 RepID=UPI0023EBDD0A|nr:DUF1080 domain-containing protein [Eudoraea chungangensis]